MADNELNGTNIKEIEKDIAHEILTSIRQIVRCISEHSKYLSREVGLTVPQLVCLKTIGELEEKEDEITVVQVSRRVHLSPATVSRIIDRLVRAELVIRERRSKDRRRVCLSLTPGGYERYQTLPIPLQEKFVRGVRKLPDEERDVIVAALKKVSEMMEATEIDASPILAPDLDVRSEGMY